MLDFPDLRGEGNFTFGPSGDNFPSITKPQAPQPPKQANPKRTSSHIETVPHTPLPACPPPPPPANMPLSMELEASSQLQSLEPVIR